MRRAFQKLRSGKPGPVLLEIPQDVGADEVRHLDIYFEPPPRVLRAGDAEAVRRARTGPPAGERTLPVSPALVDLLPDGLRRGSAVGVVGPGARSLALALIAEATAAGSWAAVVGDSDLGLAAAAEAGVALAHLAGVDLSGPTASRQLSLIHI